MTNYTFENNDENLEKVAFLSLSTIKGIGFYTLKKIYSKNLGFYELFKKAQSICEFEDELKKFGSRSLKISEISRNVSWEEFRAATWRAGKSIFNDCTKKGIKILFSHDSEFPQKLREIPDSPNWLFVQGSLSVLHKKSIALVGTRSPSEDGLFLAKYLGLLLPQLGFESTVSGLAPGIDQAIHKYSIQSSIPTIAFLGTGIFSNYPHGTDDLKKNIINTGGALVSEYLPYQSYSAENFVKRNRLQAGLCDVLIPVEWKIKSGTAHTVNYAKRYKRKVICLLLPHWLSKNRKTALAIKEHGTATFVIPGQEKELLCFFEEIKNSKNSNIRQLSLF